MIKVHTIEIDNIRSIGHAVFEPLIDGGMTAVNGPNGAGKSSILGALIWALFGVTPDGVPQSAMRRQGSEGTCRAIIDFEYDNQIITVERGLKGRNDSPYVIVKTNGVEQAKGKIRAAEAWLVNLLGGLDAEGFMTAFVIRQKELDGLVKAKPAARRALIERLAGIDRMSAAVKSARDEETEIKKRLELLPGNPDAVREARAALAEAEDRAISLYETYETTIAAVDAAATAAAEAESAAAAMQELVNAHTQASTVLTEERHALQMTQERAQVARRDLDQAMAAAVGGSDSEVAAAQSAFEAASAALQENKQAREGADRAVEEAARETARAAQSQERATRARSAADRAQSDASQAQARLGQFTTDAAEQAVQTERELAEKTQQVGALRGEHERLAASIKAMESTQAGDSCCPTCSTALSDPTLVLASLREALARVRTDGLAAKGQADELEAQVRSLRDQANRFGTAQTEARHAAQAAESAEAAAVEAERDAGEAASVAAEANSRAENAKNQAMSAAQQTYPLTTAVEAASTALRQAQVAADAASRVPALTAAAQHVDQAVAEAQRRFDQATADEVAKRVDQEHRETVMATHHEKQRAVSEAGRAKVEAHGNFRVAEEQVNSAERVRDAEQMRMEARAEAHALLEQKTAVREALDFFRKDRIASLAPELSEIATDKIAHMTDGKYVALELDEEFTPVVTDAQGRLRPATWLSGGEESAVALALRLAIGEVIAGQQGGLLWMDEPQTAMDASRRPAMMSVIRSLSGRQPIIISHVTEAADMVDLVVEVIPDDDEGSRVVRSGTTQSIDQSTLDALDNLDHLDHLDSMDTLEEVGA